MGSIAYDARILAFAESAVSIGSLDGRLAIPFVCGEPQRALLAWQKAVLVAVQEVEDSLLVRSQEAERNAALASTVEHRRRSLQRAESLQREGQIDLLVLLDVQRSYKAERCGIKIEYVDPAYTSQTCAQCGALGVRRGDVFSCTTCGHSHADVQAALNIAAGGVARPGRGKPSRIAAKCKSVSHCEN